MRKTIPLSAGWQFLKKAASVQEAVEAAASGEAVCLPHTWNAVDGQDGGNDYYRGTCWYIRELSEEELIVPSIHFQAELT